MKKIITLLFVFQLFISFGQIQFEEHLISDNTEGAVSLHACDIDNDFDIDIIGAVYEEHKIVCWYNQGNNIDFQRITIESNFSEAGTVHSGDYNNDGLPDIAGGARLGNKVCVWYNTGDPNNWSKQTLHNNYLYAHELYSTDIDGDSDIDLLGASSSLNEITLWQNNGGDPVNWEEITIDDNFGMAKSVTSADIDNDGNLDIIGAALSDNEIAWWSYTDGSWNKNTIVNNYSGVHSVQAVDMNNDGNMDILAAAYINNSIAWWKNDGNNPISWEKETIQIGFANACIAFGCDFNNDNNIEVVGTSQGNDELALFENIDDPIQWEKNIIDEVLAAWSLEVADMDDDGDMDIFAASGKGGGNKLVKWYENKTINVGNRKIQHEKVIPIYQVKNRLFVEINENVKKGSVSIFNIQGQKIHHFTEINKGKNDYKILIPNEGIYIINIMYDGNYLTRKMLLYNQH